MQGFDSIMHCDIVVVVAVTHTCKRVMYDYKMYPMTHDDHELQLRYPNLVKQPWCFHSVVGCHGDAPTAWMYKSLHFRLLDNAW